MLRAHPASTPSTLLWLLVEDAFNIGQAAAKFGVMREAFTAKVRSFSDIQSAATFDAVERYRAAKDAGRRPPADIPVR